MFGGGQEAGLRPGTIPTPLCIGFAEAMKIIVQKGAAERAAVAALRDRLAAGLRAAASNLVETARTAPRHPGNLHVHFPGVNADDLLNRLQPDLAASTGSACVSGSLARSHVMRAIGATNEQSAECIRLSVGRFTPDDDIDRAISLIREALLQIDGN